MLFPSFFNTLFVHFSLFTKKYKGNPRVYYVVMTIRPVLHTTGGERLFESGKIKDNPGITNHTFTSLLPGDTKITMK